MKLFVVRFACGFVAEKIPVGTCVLICTVCLIRLLTDGESHRTVGVLRFYRRHYIAHNRVCVVCVLAALHDEGSEAEFVPRLTAGENLLLAETVSIRIAVASPYSAVKAVVLTVVRKLDKPPYIDVFSVHRLSDFIGLLTYVLKALRRHAVYERHPLFF